MTEPTLIETTSAAAAGATRRLTTAANVKAVLEITVSSWDTLIESLIDRVSDQAARYCNLAEDSAGTPSTLGRETLRATWRAYTERDGNLFLPWRPKIAITSLTEGGVSLIAETDYRLLAGGELQRLSGGAPSLWDPCLSVIATFTCGFGTLPGATPPAVESEVIEQVKMRFLARKRDSTLRNETIPDVWSGSWNVAGGDTIGGSGLLPPLEAALAPYRRFMIA